MYYCNKDHGFECTPSRFRHGHLISVTMLYVYLKYIYIKCQIFALIKIFLNLNMNFWVLYLKKKKNNPKKNLSWSVKFQNLRLYLSNLSSKYIATIVFWYQM